MIIDDWNDVDSLAGTESILVSSHGIGYMMYSDDMLDDLIATFEPEERDRMLVAKFRAEKERRRLLDV